MDLTVKKPVKRKHASSLDNEEECSSIKTVRFDSCVTGESSSDNVQHDDVQQKQTYSDGIPSDKERNVINEQNSATERSIQVHQSFIRPDAISEHGSVDVQSVSTDRETIAISHSCENIQVGEVQPSKKPSASLSCSESATDEEKDRFAFISQQLDILNTQTQAIPNKQHPVARSPAKFNKSITKSGKDGRQKASFKMKIKLGEKHRLAAVKKAIHSPRTHRYKEPKPAVVDCNPSPEMKSECSDEGDLTPSRTDDSGGRTESEDSEDSLEIEEHEETYMEKIPKRKAGKNSVNAHSVTDSHMIDTEQDSVIDNISDDQQEASYEPKQTRSKTKFGDALFPWVLSPVKKSTSEPKPYFMEMMFSDEEEEDEEYQPEKDLEAEDTDTESIVSSRMSDFGSPCPTTPSTPAAGSLSGLKETKEDSEIFQSPMNPPSTSARPSASRELAKKFQDAMENADDQIDPETVAHRTRSKVPLTSTSLLELESSFVAPDITSDMYHTDLNDPNWASFLTGLHIPCIETVDDENSDPEYNFLAEIEEEELDKEDFRNDKATKITKKEVNELLDELLSEYADMEETTEEEEMPVALVKSRETSDTYSSSSSEIKTESSDQEETTQADTVWSSESGELTESDETALQIADDVETDFDKRLEADAEKNNLTAANVKSLLHHIITNEHVVDMLQNSLSAELDADVKEAAYEPKMTRSKTKVANAQALFPWVLSPVKKSTSEAKPNFMEMMFSEEEEEDEEYQPEIDLEAIDTDTDSVVSSRMSDFGSPCPTTPSTPGFGSVPRKDDTHRNQKDSEIFQSPLNPPPVSGKLSSARQLGRKFQDAMDKANDEEAGTIAHRTRSKVPLTNTSLLELESSFVAPDITADMYETNLDDPDWANFLTGLQAPPKESEETRDTVDDENSDPEYNFLAEIEEEEPDKEDFRNDKATKITKKELNELLDELVIAYGEGETTEKGSVSKPQQPTAPPRLQQTVPSPNTTANIKLSQQELAQLNHQMKKHVQLLTQVFLLSHERKSHHGYAKRCRCFLNELKQFGSCMPSSMTSTFHPSNLNPALDIVTGPLPKTRKPQQLAKLRNNKPTCVELSNEVMELMWTDRTFCYPQLLPVSNFLPHHIATYQKVVFTPAEDRLIAMGLDDFWSFGESKNEMVQKNLLPCKSVKQIKCRIKNQVARKEDNVIKMYWKNKQLPELPNSTELNDCGSAFPQWFQIRDQKQKRSFLLRRRSHSLSRAMDVESELRKSLEKITRKRRSSSGVRSAPTSPHLSPLPSVKFTKTIPFSDAVKKLLDFGTEEIRASNRSPIKSAIPIALVHVADNKAVISPIPGSPQLSCDQKIAALNSSPKVVKAAGIVGLPLSSEVTCVAPSILINRGLSTAVPSSLTTCTTTTMSRGLISFTGVNNMIPFTKVTAESLNSKEETSPVSPNVPHLSQSAANPATQTKSAAEIMAAVAPFLSSPKTSPLVQPGLKTPTKEKSPDQKVVEKTPPRGEQTHLRQLVPSPHISPTKRIVLPYVPKRRKQNSPRRQQLKKQAKAILPKGFIVRSDPISPVKKAAYKVKSKARRVGRQRTLLPKPVLSLSAEQFSEKQEDTPTEKKCEEELENMEADVNSVCETLESDGEAGEDAEKGENQDKENSSPGEKREGKCSTQSSAQRDSADSQSEGEGTTALPYDSQTEEEEGGGDEGDVDEGVTHLQELMEASTTIRNSVFQPKKPGMKDRRSKAQKHKDITLAMLDPDLIQADPHRDDRDIVFAQAYLDSVKTALKDDQKKYGQFLQSLYEFGKKPDSPIELYEKVKVILKDYPELVEDFSGFLLPEQAVKCGCYMSNQHFYKVRSFLRKLEIHFEKHPSQFQKIIKTFSQWRSGKSPQEIQAMLQPLLKGQQHLLEEFSLFFETERPPESHMTDFEEIDMGDSDLEDGHFLDGYEEVELSDEMDMYGTKRCECKCHDTKTDPRFFKRKRHCNSCGLKIIGGKLYFRTARNILIPAVAVYHKSFWMDEQRQSADLNSCVDNKDNLPALLSLENVIKENGLQNKPTDKIQVESAPVRKRIKPITLRAVPQGGRFITLDEMDETQDRTPIPWMTVTQSDRSWKRTFTVGKTMMKTIQDSAKTHYPSKTKCDRNVINVIEAGGAQVDSSDRLSGDVQDATPVTVNNTDSCDKLSVNRTATSFSNPSFLPSPCKDSNSSSSQDILARAMKVAHVTNSDAELSLDQPPVSQQLSGTSAGCRTGEVTLGGISMADQTSCTPSSEPPEDVTWTKDTDRIILLTCQSFGTTDAAFQGIAKELNISETQVRERFATLMNILMNKNDDDENKGEG